MQSSPAAELEPGGAICQVQTLCFGAHDHSNEGANASVYMASGVFAVIPIHHFTI